MDLLNKNKNLNVKKEHQEDKSFKHKKGKDLKRAPKIGELLNLFHITEEVENKKLFETKEKNYSLRMIENHIFPKKTSEEHKRKLFNLLKRKEPNYHIKRKYLKFANIESDKEGQFRLTLSKSFYKQLSNKGEINLQSKRLLNTINENIHKKEVIDIKGYTKNPFLPIIDNIALYKKQSILNNSHFNQALKEMIIDGNYDDYNEDIIIEDNKGRNDINESQEKEDNYTKSESNIVDYEAYISKKTRQVGSSNKSDSNPYNQLSISSLNKKNSTKENDRNSFKINYMNLNNEDFESKEHSIPKSRHSTVLYSNTKKSSSIVNGVKNPLELTRKHTTNSSLEVNLFNKINEAFEINSKHTKYKKEKTFKNKTNLRDIVPEFYAFENTKENNKENDSDSDDNEIYNIHINKNNNSNRNVSKINKNPLNVIDEYSQNNTSNIKDINKAKLSILEKALLKKLDENTNNYSYNNNNSNVPLTEPNANGYFKNSKLSKINNLQKNYFNEYLPSYESISINNSNAFNNFNTNINHNALPTSPIKSLPNTFSNVVTNESVSYLNTQGNNINVMNTSEANEDTYLTSLPKLQKIKDYRKGLKIIKSGLDHINTTNNNIASSGNNKNKNYLETHELEKDINIKNNININKKKVKSHLLSIVSLNNNGKYMKNTNKVNQINSFNSDHDSFENLSSSRNARDVLNKNKNIKNTKIDEENDDNQIFSKQTMFIYEKHKWERIKKDNVSIKL